MPVEPFSWNSVVIGAWNRAILSPDGIRRRLFQLPENATLEIEIAVDRPGFFRVAHEGVLVIPTSTRLEVATRLPNVESLGRACALCERALLSLPETPVTAAGVNIRYRMTEVPDAVLDLVRAPLDTALADANFAVSASETKRSVTVAPGVVNVQIVQRGGSGTLEFNFHRESTSIDELIEWLRRSDRFVDFSDRLAAVAGVPDVRREINQ